MLAYTELGKGFFLVQEDTARGNKLNSLLLEDGTKSRVVLIDSNYPFNFIDELYTRVKAPVLGIYYSHCHLDHTAHAYYHQEKYGAPIYVPVQEKEHLLSLDALMEDVGYNALGLKEMYFLIAIEYLLTPKEKINPIIKDGYLLWDGGMILQHFKEFLEQGIIEKVEEKSILDDTYILLK